MFDSLPFKKTNFGVGDFIIYLFKEPNLFTFLFLLVLIITVLLCTLIVRNTNRMKRVVGIIFSLLFFMSACSTLYPFAKEYKHNTDSMELVKAIKSIIDEKEVTTFTVLDTAFVSSYLSPDGLYWLDELSLVKSCKQGVVLQVEDPSGKSYYVTGPVQVNESENNQTYLNAYSISMDEIINGLFQGELFVPSSIYSEIDCR
ncbi:hypothetical protein [Bacillus sp. AK128]